MVPEVQEQACPHHFVIVRQGALNKEATVEAREPHIQAKCSSFYRLLWKKKLDFNYRKMGMMTKYTN